MAATTANATPTPIPAFAPLESVGSGSGVGDVGWTVTAVWLEVDVGKEVVVGEGDVVLVGVAKDEVACMLTFDVASAEYRAPPGEVSVACQPTVTAYAKAPKDVELVDLTELVVPFTT